MPWLAQDSRSGRSRADVAQPYQISLGEAVGKRPVFECPGSAGCGQAARLRAVSVLGALALAVVFWAGAQVTPVKRVRDFRMPEFYEGGAADPNPRLKSLVVGAEAQPVDAQGRLIALSKMQVESYLPDGRTNLVARAPTCLLDALGRTVSSTGRVEATLAQGQLFIEGQGFYLQITNLHLIISNQVRTVIRPELWQRAAP